MTIARRFNAGKSGVDWQGPKGRLNPRVRPSLRDLVSGGVDPGVKTPGYCRTFLRNTTNHAEENFKFFRHSLNPHL